MTDNELISVLADSITSAASERSTVQDPDIAACALLDGPLDISAVVAQLPVVVELLNRIDGIHSACRTGEVSDITALMWIMRSINEWRTNPQRDEAQTGRQGDAT